MAPASTRLQAQNSVGESEITSALAEYSTGETRDGGVTWRVTILAIALAVVFGYIIPIIDVRLSNTFLGAAHLPPGAVGVLLLLVLVIKSLLMYAARPSQNRIMTLGAALACGSLSGAAFYFWDWHWATWR